MSSVFLDGVALDGLEVGVALLFLVLTLVGVSQAFLVLDLVGVALAFLALALVGVALAFLVLVLVGVVLAFLALDLVGVVLAFLALDPVGVALAFLPVGVALACLEGVEDFLDDLAFGVICSLSGVFSSGSAVNSDCKAAPREDLFSSITARTTLAAPRWDLVDRVALLLVDGL